ncbi:hypothetical protein GCM10017771_46870 [Streptomyces capitiformicae]|uniref:Uncharacterized protein n=1 Tax=Streptomyces capitiformicae TaxID=2014920 RepID=A0A918YZR5_9ACTN|nr:hypothetical protein GCM10017771_46870 [Streptomyces capitiformicae]
MRSEGYELGSDIVGMLIVGRAADRFGAPRISAIWFALTAAGHATVPIRSHPENRATAVGWTSGMGRFGAVG